MCIALYLKSQVFVSFPDSNKPMHCTINTYLRCGSYVVWACTKYWFRFYNQISNMPNIKYCLKSKCYSSRTRMTVAQCPNMDRTVKLIGNNWDLRADLEFVKKFTRPIFRVKEFYTLKTRKSSLFSPVI